MKIGVTEAAIIQRLRRALATKGRYLRKADSRKQKRWGLGRYYLLDANGVVDKDVNIEQLARQLGVVVPRNVTQRLRQLRHVGRDPPGRAQSIAHFLADPPGYLR